VQAEAVVGFVNAWSRTGDPRFGELAQQVWSYIGERIVDTRPGGEWHAEVNAAGQPARRDAAGPWKANYHNGRCCLQLMERLA
jgi:mannobiose 2-epimerase